MRIRRRDVKPGMIFYQCKDSDLQTLNITGAENEEEFVLVNPLRVDKDGNIETLTFLEEVSSKEYNSDSLYVEVEDESLYLSAADQEYKQVVQSKSKNDDNDTAKYLYMGIQHWIVYNTKDPKHKFRKTVRFLLGKTFEAECERKYKIEKQKEEKGIPTQESISCEDYQTKDKRLIKHFKNDNFNALF